ncbi:DUF1592 domain-containing protein [Calycomorphotria hydatis]|uniref:Planctomycete cytochrome C n=1 Tax=Calycomorphotria hydatis TaxID=2528027 RepID=A0A517TBM1_9PLAN|nr:DUF1592 domain-containing protein [Calycomorphotria hydatis]QDT65774.1 hypothetical protein V22_30350 [Calycomorphotria hydatis]
MGIPLVLRSILAVLVLCATASAGVKSSSAFIESYCIDCHGDAEPDGGLDLVNLEWSPMDTANRLKWISVFDRVYKSEMPPKDAEKPPVLETKGFLQKLGPVLYQVDQSESETILRRLNRREYEYTVRDLFSINVDVKDMLPEDGTSHGFDVVGEALAISTEQIEAYLAAADLIIDEILGPPRQSKSTLKTDDLSNNVPSYLIHKKVRVLDNSIVMFNRTQAAGKFQELTVRTAGTYRVKVNAKAFQSEKPLVMSIHAGDVITNRRGKHLIGYYDVHPGPNWTEIEFTTELSRGDTFEVAPYGTGLGYKSDANTTNIPGVQVGQAEMEGPLTNVWPPESRTQLLRGIDPKRATPADITNVLNRVLPRLFRRNVDSKEVAAFTQLGTTTLQAGRPWIEALRVSLKAALCSPEFLFLEEPVSNELDGYALASRLSFMLWRSSPDDELLSLAANGTLNDPAILGSQVERLLTDSKSQRFVDDFTGQWLDLHEIDFTEPDSSLYPEFDEFLKVSMLEETRRHFRKILDEDRSTAEFIDSDWLVLNERLATHYNLPGVYGVDFREVNLPPDSLRGGVLTQGAVLKVTANGTNTSPVLRGVWVLERIMGKSTPPPPSNVPAVEPDIRGTTTLRELLERHRSDENCAGCHSKIDPPGFALESFDVIGGHRDWYRSLTAGDRVNRTYGPAGVKRVAYKKAQDVDATGTLEGHGKFNDIQDFKKLLLKEPEQITHCLVEKLLIFGTGRELSFSDRVDMKSIVESVAKEKHGFRTLLHHVIQSKVFQSP